MKLSEALEAFRTRRPDEWTMDDFKRQSIIMEDALNEFVTEYCERYGDIDLPLPAEEQSCETVRKAMKALDIS